MTRIRFPTTELAGDKKMALQPADWSVVILGRWNRAILTPHGIAKWLFRLGEGKPVEVNVPLDGVSPYIVKHPMQQIVVMTDESRLLIQVAKANYQTLWHAMAAGVNALTALPQTPVYAAGFNINCRSKEVTSQMAYLLVSESEKALVDAGFKPLARTVGRSLEHGAGTLNVTVTGGEDGCGLSLNFHRGSEVVEELREWLQTPVEQVEATVKKVLDTFGLDIEEIRNDADAE
jgi:hypothetical protein